MFSSLLDDTSDKVEVEACVEGCVEGFSDTLSP
jgi:hypothetical protein